MDKFNPIVSDLVMEQQLHAVIDGLAEQGFAVIDQFVSEQEVKALKSCAIQLDETGALKKAGIGKQLQYQKDKDIRGDYIKWLNEDESQKAPNDLLQKMQGVMQALNRYCFLGLKDIESHFAVYPEGTGYQRHSDCFQRNAHRVISFVLYLNENWKTEDGGALRIYLPEDKTVEVLPQAGRLVCFRSEIEHEVMIAHRQRYSMTGWMLNQLSDLTFL